MSQPFTMSGFLRFDHNGETQVAPAKVTVTRLPTHAYRCRLEVTHQGQTYQAQFEVPAQQGPEAQWQAFQAGILTALRTWPHPWTEIREAFIKLDLDRG